MGKKTAAAMGKQETTGKEVAVEWNKKRAAELDKKRRGDVVFFSSNLDNDALVARYGYMWGSRIHPISIAFFVPISSAASALLSQISSRR